MSLPPRLGRYLWAHKEHLQLYRSVHQDSYGSRLSLPNGEWEQVDSLFERVSASLQGELAVILTEESAEDAGVLVYVFFEPLVNTVIALSYVEQKASIVADELLWDQFGTEFRDLIDEAERLLHEGCVIDALLHSLRKLEAIGPVGRIQEATIPREHNTTTLSDETIAYRGGVWRRGNTLIMHKDAPLPDRCIKCNIATNGSHIRRTLSWHHPALAFVALAGVVPYLVLAWIFNKSATVDVSLCERHIRERTTSIVVSWVLGALGIGSVVLGIVQWNSICFLIGAALILVSIVYAFVRAQVPVVSRMDDQHIWLNRVNKEFLDQVPELPTAP